MSEKLQELQHGIASEKPMFAHASKNQLQRLPYPEYVTITCTVPVKQNAPSSPTFPPTNMRKISNKLARRGGIKN